MKGMERSGRSVRTENEAGDRREKHATHAHGVCEAHMRFVLKYHAGALHLAKPTVLQSSICLSRHLFPKGGNMNLLTSFNSLGSNFIKNTSSTVILRAKVEHLSWSNVNNSISPIVEKCLNV